MVTASKCQERWNEASIHYHDALLVCGDQMFLRCREPAWRVSRNQSVFYLASRQTMWPHDQFGLDRLDELRSYSTRTSRMEWGDLMFDACIEHFTCPHDEAALLSDMGMEALKVVPTFRKITTRADRARLECDASLAQLERCYSGGGALNATDARYVLEEVDRMIRRLYHVIKPRQTAIRIANDSRKANERVRYWNEVAQQLSPEDLQALAF